MQFAMLAKLWIVAAGLVNDFGPREIVLPGSCERAPVKIDYRLYATGTEWRWDEGRAHLAGCFAGTTFPLDVTLCKKAGESDSIIVRFSKDEKPVISFKAAHFTVFWINKDRLYHSFHHPGVMGASIIAYDLNTGKMLWNSRMKGLQDPRPHSVYSNYLNLTAGEETVEVFGNESYGRYFEILDARTGKTLGHKVFPEVEK